MPLEAAKIAAAQIADLKVLELLYDYTKFHIGVYLTMAASFITVASLKKGDSFLLELRRPLVAAAIACFMLAGLAGGVIVSSLTQCYGTTPSEQIARCSSVPEFLAQSHGPWNGEIIFLSGRVWTWIEHTAFWAGLGFAVCSFKPRTPSVPWKAKLKARR